MKKYIVLLLLFFLVGCKNDALKVRASSFIYEGTIYDELDIEEIKVRMDEYYIKDDKNIPKSVFLIDRRPFEITFISIKYENNDDRESFDFTYDHQKGHIYYGTFKNNHKTIDVTISFVEYKVDGFLTMRLLMDGQYYTMRPEY